MNTDITDKSTLQSSWTDSITTIERKTHYVVASYTMYTNMLVRERNQRKSKVLEPYRLKVMSRAKTRKSRYWMKEALVIGDV